jgi:hypothetical protein
VPPIKQQLLDTFENRDFSRQALGEISNLCECWLLNDCPGPHGIHDRVIIYSLQDFCFSVAQYMSGQEDASSGLTTVRHTKIQAAIAPHLRSVMNCLNSQDSDSILAVLDNFICAFERMKREQI